MAEQYRFFGSAVGDTREYSQVEFAEVFGTIIGNGYLGQVGNELVTTENTPVGMSVLVGTGQAWINGYWYSNESVKEIPISTADATNPRIDRVVLRLDVLNARSIVAVVKTGTPASTPVAPSLTQTEQLWEIPLYQVYVAPSVLAIYDEDLIDERYQALLQDTDEILEIVDTKAPINSPTFTGTVSGITKSMVGLGNVDNTSDANKPISTATQTALDGKLSLTGGTLTGALNGTTITTSGDIKNSYITLTGDRIENYSLNTVANVSINYTGYQGGTTQFRNLNVFDGKGNLIANFVGSDKSFNLTGALNTNGQIKFPATQNPSADANTLDDYEEGTFTPDVLGTTSIGVGTYTAQIGKYTKIGNRVIFNSRLTWTAHTGTGYLQISLPFISRELCATAQYSDSLTMTNATLNGFTQLNTNRIELNLIRIDGVYIGPLPMDTSGTIIISGSYLTD